MVCCWSLDFAPGARDFGARCNLHNITKGPHAILEFTRAMLNDAGTLAPGDVYPDYSAAIVYC